MIRSCFFALVLLFVALPLWADNAPEFPTLTGRVVDEVGALSPAASERLTAELAAHEKRTGQQVVVAVVKSLQGRAVEEYGYQLGRSWGIGQKGTNTGAILLVAPNDRKIRIEVGYGLEGQLTDALCAIIINQVILPRFRTGDMEDGVVAGTEEILRALGDKLSEVPLLPMPHSEPQGTGSISSILLTFLVFALFIWIMRRRGIGVFPFFVAGSWSSRGGGYGGGSFGGDRFSGGGGSFGGGGASGSW